MKFLRQAKGATATEYGLLAALIALTVVGAARTLGWGLSDHFWYITMRMMLIVGGANGSFWNGSDLMTASLVWSYGGDDQELTLAELQQASNELCPFGVDHCRDPQLTNDFIYADGDESGFLDEDEFEFDYKYGPSFGDAPGPPEPP